jgi:hypothetical protein
MSFPSRSEIDKRMLAAKKEMVKSNVGTTKYTNYYSGVVEALRWVIGETDEIAWMRNIPFRDDSQNEPA